MLTKKQIDELLGLIADAVQEDEPWSEKRDAILAECNDTLKMQLGEFIVWFEGELE